MRKGIGLVFIIVGLIFIGIGAYNGFEIITNEFVFESNKSYYDGLYLASGDTIVVDSLDLDHLNVTINNTTYLFTYNGDYYENKDSGFYIIFNDDKLVLYKDDEKIRTLTKEK